MSKIGVTGDFLLSSSGSQVLFSLSSVSFLCACTSLMDLFKNIYVYLYGCNKV